MSVDTTKTDVAVKPDEVTLTIDGTQVSVPKGALVIRAAEKAGIAIPRFCDHPLLDPVGACRQCLVEIPDAGNGRGFPKPQASCTIEAADGMVVETQLTSPKAHKAQAGMLELLLINHPLDCPICDKGGECPLQNQALSDGPGETRFGGYAKRTFPKPVEISQLVLLDRERCVLCARCTRFSEQISGDPFIALAERGALQQVARYEDEPYDSYFSGNVIQICPVGALTSSDYRFQSRPFDLVSTPTTCEHCAAGCSLRTDHRHYQVKRRMAGLDMDVNEEWNCDKGRFAFLYGRGDDLLTRPLIREDGVLRPASWPEAIDAAVEGLQRAGNAVGVLPGGRLTNENAYGYSKFARTVLGTNNIDYRSRPHSAEELAFLGSNVAGRPMDLTYADLEKAPTVVTVCLDVEEESPIVFLRLRKAVRKHHQQVIALAPFLSYGYRKLSATLVEAVPGTEASVLRQFDVAPDTVILVGERAAQSAGLLTALAELTARGAKVAWIPRRAGELGAIEAGCLPTLLPGGRLVDDAAARVDAGATWGVGSLPDAAGLDAEAMLAAATAGEVKALICAGIEPRDFADPHAVRAGLEAAEFVISLEQRHSEVTERANVVFPVALLEDQAGHFLNWERRLRTVNRVIKRGGSPMTDLRVLSALADALGADLGLRSVEQASAELAEFEPFTTHAAAPQTGDGVRAQGVVLATWRELIDDSRADANAEHLMATARKPVLKMSPGTAAAHGITTDATVETDAGEITLPVEIVTPMVDDVVWLPANSVGCCVNETLQIQAGQPVRLSAAAQGGTL